MRYDVRKLWNYFFGKSVFKVGPKLPKDDLPPRDQYFDMSFEADLHAMFVLMIVDLGFAHNRDALDMQYGHDLRPGSLTRVCRAGYVELKSNGVLQLTPEGLGKLDSLRASGMLCKGK